MDNFPSSVVGIEPPVFGLVRRTSNILCPQLVPAERTVASETQSRVLAGVILETDERPHAW